MSHLGSCSDDTLISLLRQGSHEAFEELYNRYWLVIYRRFFKKLQSKALAEEYTQELFTSLWSRRSELTISISLIHYLNGAVRKMVVTNIRNEIRKKSMLEGFQHVPIINSEEDEQVFSTLHHALGDLPGKTNEIIRLSKLEGRSVKEIARLQDLSDKSVEYHITKALKMLRAYFKNSRDVAASVLFWVFCF
jgi:RNA polymerase sigma factor (sigma-70 family)